MNLKTKILFWSVIILFVIIPKIISMIPKSDRSIEIDLSFLGWFGHVFKFIVLIPVRFIDGFFSFFPAGHDHEFGSELKKTGKGVQKAAKSKQAGTVAGTVDQVRAAKKTTSGDEFDDCERFQQKEIFFHDEPEAGPIFEFDIKNNPNNK